VPKRPLSAIAPVRLSGLGAARHRRLSGQAPYRLLSSIAVPPKAAKSIIVPHSKNKPSSFKQKIKFLIFIFFLKNSCIENGFE
jgi:hypothetical protein